MTDVLTFSSVVRAHRNAIGSSIFIAANGLVGGASASLVKIGTTALTIISLLETFFLAKPVRRNPITCWRVDSKLRLFENFTCSIQGGPVLSNHHSIAHQKIGFC